MNGAWYDAGGVWYWAQVLFAKRLASLSKWCLLRHGQNVAMQNSNIQVEWVNSQFTLLSKCRLSLSCERSPTLCTMTTMMMIMMTITTLLLVTTIAGHCRNSLSFRRLILMLHWRWKGSRRCVIASCKNAPQRGLQMKLQCVEYKVHSYVSE